MAAFFRLHIKVIAFLGLFVAALLVAYLLTPEEETVFPLIIVQTGDDGTESDSGTWFEDGVESSLNLLGRKGANRFSAGLRFHPGPLGLGGEIAYARLRFASAGCRLSGPLEVTIEGVAENISSFSSTNRPSQMTERYPTKIRWLIEEPWLEGSEELPLFYNSPDIAPLLNERRKASGSFDQIALVLTAKELSGSAGDRFVAFYDYRYGTGPEKRPVELEIYPTVYDAFLGKELLGRVTDRSAELYLYSLIDTDLHVEYGTAPGAYTARTPLLENRPAKRRIRVEIPSLSPDTRYHYRLLYRRAGQGEFARGAERTFHTQRRRKAPFSFSIMSDEHLLSCFKRIIHDPESLVYPGEMNRRLYEVTLRNIADSQPDFLISMGDFANTEFYNGRNASNYQDALERYLLQRSYIDRITHSIPFYLTVGNHEGENGWYYHSDNNDYRDLAIFSTRARKETIPNPRPGPFYSGNTDEVPEFGLREDYYSWEWGDALFVVLCPFWYTTTCPHEPISGAHHPSSLDGWDWTIGKQQYDWLHDTLQRSDARWRFVFIHHLTSTNTVDHDNAFYGYGRGGIEIAKHKVDRRATFEWGGENESGENVFSWMRPDWSHGPVHDLLVAQNVDIVFHGHDHLFGMQRLDRIVYQECPQPINSKSSGYRFEGWYKHGEFFPNSGHLQVTVLSEEVKVEYIRSFLPGEGPNKKIAFAYIVR